MVAEAVISIGAGIVAGSLLLVAFGLDSIVEFISGGVLFWRLSVEGRGGDVEDVEQVARVERDGDPPPRADRRP